MLFFVLGGTRLLRQKAMTSTGRLGGRRRSDAGAARRAQEAQLYGDAEGEAVGEHERIASGEG